MKKTSELFPDSIEGREHRKSAKKIAVLGALLLVVGVLFLVSIVRDYDVKGAIRLAMAADGRWLALAAGLAALSVLFSAASFFFALSGMGIRARGGRILGYACSYLFFGNVTPAALGSQPLTVYAMCRDGIDLSQGVIVSLLNTVLYKLLLVALGVVAACVMPDTIFGNPVLCALFVWGMLFTIAFITACAMAIWAYKLLRKIGAWVLTILYRIKLLRNKEKWLFRFTRAMRQYRESAEYLGKHPSVAFKMSACILLQRMAAFSVAYFVALALGAGEVDYLSLLCVQILVSLTVDSLPFPGGVGIAESITVGLYRVVFEEGLIVSAMILNRGIGFYLLTAVCGLAVLIAFCCAKKRRGGTQA